MRRIKTSRTFDDALATILLAGAARFGAAVAEKKLDDVGRAIRTVLANRPTSGKRVSKLKLYKYEIRSAPIVILYDFDDDEVRIHTVVHARSDVQNTDLSEIEW